MTTVALHSRRLTLPDYFAAVERFAGEGWTDGLPIVPPTAERVEAMLAVLGREPGEVVGRLAPRFGVATLEKVAINAVMAGCRPEYFPVVVAAIEAIADDEFNLNGVQATTHVAAPLCIVNGPVRRALDINGGPNCFGQGWRANATIGRAVRLCMINLGGGLPGLTDKATFGHPGKYSYCVAEQEEASPWEPLHVSRGFRPDQSAVTLFAAEAPHSVSDHVSRTGRGILTTVADTLATMGNNNMYKQGECLVVIGVEHGQTLAEEGWGRRDVQQFLFETARRPLHRLKQGGEYYGDATWEKYWPKWIDRTDENALIPVVSRPEDILVIVAGGSVGRFSLVIPGWGRLGSRAVTKVVAAVPAVTAARGDTDRTASGAPAASATGT
ncbi:MAG: hypothetical protein ACREKK_07665, partial [Candidatus Methylomirabilales bacterium]